jgi:pimeloyl-ACP methyl ester carboxylesterase
MSTYSSWIYLRPFIHSRSELSEFNINNIDVSKPLAVYIHGYLANKLETSWVYPAMLGTAHNFMRRFANNLQYSLPEHAKFFNTNICALNWFNITIKMADVTVRYVPMVGTYLASALNRLNLKGMDYKNMTLVGHSFGAHVAGIVGRKTGGKIGAIYALDPAGPYFYDQSNILSDSNDNRLDKTDGQFVQVLHTNCKVFGTRQQMGHQDFYPNGGGGMPNCTNSFSVGE